MPADKKRPSPDAEALIAALLQQLKNTTSWHETFVRRWVELLRDNGVADEEIADALGVNRTTVSRRYGRRPRRPSRIRAE